MAPAEWFVIESVTEPTVAESLHRVLLYIESLPQHALERFLVLVTRMIDFVEDHTGQPPEGGGPPPPKQGASLIRGASSICARKRR